MTQSPIILRAHIPQLDPYNDANRIIYYSFKTKWGWTHNFYYKGKVVKHAILIRRSQLQCGPKVSTILDIMLRSQG